MNENTRIAICCYQGDQHYVIKALGNYLQHECPVVVLSPEDSKAEIRYPGIENRFAGKRAYIGQDSLDRQRLHLSELLKFPESFFLIHDSDSICLSAKLPQYLYDEPDHVWSNLVNDDIPEHLPEFKSRGERWPHVAFQPPYFLSRKTIKRLLEVADHPGVKASSIMPFIDFYMVQLTMYSGCSYRRFPHCVSCSDHPSMSGAEILSKQVREDGAVFIHSVKRPEVYQRLLEDRKRYLETHR